MVGSSESMALMGMFGSITSAFGSFAQGAEQEKAYEFNADIALQNAQHTRTAEALHQTQMEFQKKKVIGMQPAEYAGRGVKANTGSPIDMMVTTLAQFNLDQAISGYNAEVSARGLENQAAMDTYEGKMAKKSADTKGAMQLLSSGVDAAILFGAFA